MKRTGFGAWAVVLGLLFVADAVWLHTTLTQFAIINAFSLISYLCGRMD